MKQKELWFNYEIYRSNNLRCLSKVLFCSTLSTENIISSIIRVFVGDTLFFWMIFAIIYFEYNMTHQYTFDSLHLVSVIRYLDGNLANKLYGHANITSLHASYNIWGPPFWYILVSMVGFLGGGGPSRCAVTLRTMHSSSSFDGVFSLAFTGVGI